MNEEIITKLNKMGFVKNTYGGMKINIEGVIITAAEHPLKGIYLSSVYSSGKRSASMYEKFIHRDSTIPEIAKALLEIHSKLKEPEPEKSVRQEKEIRRETNYYTYKNDKYSCDKCSWKGMGSELKTGEMFEVGVEIHCPDCGERIPGLIEFPFAEEMIEKGSEDDKLTGNYVKSFRSKWEASILKDVNQLPELYDDYMAFVLREIEDEHGENYVVISYEGKEIWREIRSYEYYWRFIEIGKLFKQKYGNRMIDLVPDVYPYHLYGDCLGAPGLIENFRKSLHRRKKETKN